MFKKNNKTYFIFTPIFYPNGDPHIGHKITIDTANYFERKYKLFGNNVIKITGIDSHGDKVYNFAQKNNISYYDLLNKYKLKFENITKDYDIFYNTENKGHYLLVNSLFELQYCYLNNIYNGVYSGYYCTREEKYLTENDYRNILSNNSKEQIKKYTSTIINKKENGLYLKIDKELKSCIINNKNNNILDYIKNQYQVFNSIFITRSGHYNYLIPIDNYHTKISFYVWFDAINYYKSIIFRYLIEICSKICNNKTHNKFCIFFKSNNANLVLKSILDKDISIFKNNIKINIEKLNNINNLHTNFNNNFKILIVIGNDILKFHTKLLSSLFYSVFNGEIKYNLYIHGIISYKNAKVSKSFNNFNEVNILYDNYSNFIIPAINDEKNNNPLASIQISEDIIVNYIAFVKNKSINYIFRCFSIINLYNYIDNNQIIEHIMKLNNVNDYLTNIKKELTTDNIIAVDLYKKHCILSNDYIDLHKPWQKDNSNKDILEVISTIYIHLMIVIHFEYLINNNFIDSFDYFLFISKLNDKDRLLKMIEYLKCENIQNNIKLKLKIIK